MKRIQQFILRGKQKRKQGDKKMRPKRNLMMMGLVLAGVVALLVPLQAMASGTASGTSITNNATVDYQVGGIDQTQVPSNDAVFVVDNKVDLNVVTQDAAAVSVSPGSLFANGVYNVLRFRVTNDGNTTQDYALSVATVTTGGAAKFVGNDAFDMDPEPILNTRIFVNSVRNDLDAQVYENAIDTANFIDELEADHFVDVFVVLDAPLTATNGQIASYHLVATTYDAGAAGLGAQTTETAGAWVADTVQVVFADDPGSAGAGTDDASDGKFSDQDDYLVVAATLTVTKASAVISDPINGGSDPKSIPGAIIEYTITLANAAGAGAPATSIAVSDSLNTEITNGTLAFYADGYGGGHGIQVTAPNLYGGAATPLTNGNGDDEGEFTGGNVVTVIDIDLLPTEQATVKFQVEVQ